MESEIGPDEGEPSSSTDRGPEDTQTAFAPVEPAPLTPAGPPAPPTPAGQPTAPTAPTAPMPEPGPEQAMGPTGPAGPMGPMGPMPPMPPPGPGGPGQPPGPYGIQPYGYPPYGYGPPAPPTGTNGMAIAALVLGIVGFLFITPIIGLILGLIALAAVKRTGQRGRGLAISGIVLSSLWIALFATIIVIAVVVAPDPARRDADGNVVAKGSVGIFSLHPKDCFTLPSGLIGSTDSSTRNLTVVPCSTAHDSEAFGSFTTAETAYPGLDALRAEAVTQCVKILTGYLPDVAALPTGSRVQFIYANQQSWDRGERKVECFVQFPAATMTASVQRAESSYTADQLRFLHAIQPMSDAVTQLNVTSESSSLDVLQQRARDVANGMQSELSALTASPWPATVQPSIDALVAQHQNAAQLWAQAAGAEDLASYGDAIRRANAAFDMTDMQAARSALGLVGIPGGSGSGSGSTDASSSPSQAT